MIKSKHGTAIKPLDEEAFNAFHEYRIITRGEPDETGISADALETVIKFQKGPVKETGLNGIQNEDLLHIVVHRLHSFQKGPFSCRENALALTKVQEALHWLDARTQDRLDRGVEGKNEA